MPIRSIASLLESSNFVGVLVFVSCLFAGDPSPAQNLIKVPFSYSPINIDWMISAAANVAGCGGPANVTNVLRGGDVITIAAITPPTETIPRDPTIPSEAIVNMARLMGEFGIVEKAAVSTTLADAYYDNTYVDEVKQSGFLKELWR